jgi:hypothetical protein
MTGAAARPTSHLEPKQLGDLLNSQLKLRKNQKSTAELAKACVSRPANFSSCHTSLADVCFTPKAPSS